MAQNQEEVLTWEAAYAEGMMGAFHALVLDQEAVVQAMVLAPVHVAEGLGLKKAHTSHVARYYFCI